MERQANLREMSHPGVIIRLMLVQPSSPKDWRAFEHDGQRLTLLQDDGMKRSYMS